MQRDFVSAVLFLAISLALVVGAVRTGSAECAVVARTYQGLNGTPVEGPDEHLFQDSDFSWHSTLDKVSPQEVLQLQDGVLVFAYPSCPHCRNLLPVLVEEFTRSHNTLYYCDVGTIRDKYEAWDTIDGGYRLVEVTPAGEGYPELLAWLGNYALDYELTTPQGTPVQTGMKRIGVPLLVEIQNGQPVKSATLSDIGLTFLGDGYDKYAPWTDQQREEVRSALHKAGWTVP